MVGRNPSLSPMKMTKLSNSVNGSVFTPSIQAKLAKGPPTKGSRHAWLTSMAYEMVGEQNHTDTIFEELRSAVPDDDKTDDELRKIISSAERKAPQPSAANRIPALLGRPSNVRL